MAHVSFIGWLLTFLLPMTLVLVLVIDRIHGHWLGSSLSIGFS